MRASTSAISTCIVPADVALQAHGSAEIGEVDLPGGIGGNGRNVESDVVETGPRVLVIDGHAGAGLGHGSSAPYDDPACCGPASLRALTTG